LGTSVKPPVPDGEDELGVANRQGAGKMDGVSPPERMQAGELAG
jgi:hypothetical protein